MPTRARGSEKLRGSPASGAAPIRLDFESVQRVVVTSQEGDRFLTTSQEEAQACRMYVYDKEWKEQFDGFLAHIHHWAKGHSDIVLTAYVGISSEGLTGVVITKGSEYRLDFDDEVTRLDI